MIEGIFTTSTPNEAIRLRLGYWSGRIQRLFFVDGSSTNEMSVVNTRYPTHRVPIIDGTHLISDEETYEVRWRGERLCGIDASGNFVE
jgi:hypothetical protein